MSAPVTRTTNPLPSGLLVAGLMLLLIGQRVLSEGQAQTIVSGLGGVLLVVGLALRVQGMLAAKGDARAVEMRLLGANGGVFLALALYAFTTDVGAGVLGLEGEGGERLLVVLSVLWPAVLLLSLLATLFAELVYMRMPVAESVELRRVRVALHAGLTLGLSVVFLLSINYVSVEREIRKDVSYFKTTQPSEGTRALLEQLEGKIQVVLFWRRASDVLPQVEPYFAALAKSDKLEYRAMDVALAPELASKHRVRDNGTVLLLYGEEDAQKGRTIAIGENLMGARGALKRLDGSFQEAFHKLVTPERKLYLTVGHGERNAKSDGRAPPERVGVMNEVLRRLNLKSEDLGISQGLGAAVPDGASAVAIIGPTEQFMPEEVNALLEYVRKGGRLMLMLEPDVETGLEPLLQGLGLKQLPGMVMSESHHMRRTFTPRDKTIVFSNNYSSHPIVTNVSRRAGEVATVFFEGGALAKVVDTQAKPRPLVTFPLSSAKDFWRDEDGDLKHGEHELASSVNLIAAVTLRDDKGNEGRAVVVGDGDFVTDRLAQNAGNMMVYIDALGWLIGEERIAVDVSSEEDIPIEHTRDEDKLWFYATTFAVPLPLALLGAWVARMRRRRSEAR
jgi:hypothetical protein